MSADGNRLGWVLIGIFGATLAACGSATTVAPTPTAGRTLPARASIAPSVSPTVSTALPSDMVPLSLGGNFTCALTIANGLSCWGNNRYGQLGNGTILGSSVPAPIGRAAAGITAVAAGWSHACALRMTGELDCWGSNAKGQLGDGTNNDGRSPAAVAGIAARVTAVAAGHRHTCALLEGGAVKCWGENASGGVGDGTGVNRNAPVDVPDLTAGVTALDAGAGHTCALLAGGGVECWGWNAGGQVGDGSATDRRSPVAVNGLSGPATAIAAGDQHTCALLADGSVACWGANASGQLGNGTRVRSAVPVAVAGLSARATQIAAGGAHTCALLENATVQCWGDDQSGQLGDGARENRSDPTPVALPGAAVYVAAGFSHTCVLLADRRLECWGWNTEGQLGDGTVKSRRVPGDVMGFSAPAAAIAVGWSNTCALMAAGGVRCWGLNGGGQLGDGTDADSAAPVIPDGLAAGRISVAVGGSHACALSAKGGVKCWGRNDRGQLGNGTNLDQNRPVDVAGLPEEIVAVAAGRMHTCALNVFGGVKCWGANEDGQLGNGTNVDNHEPVEVVGLAAGVVAIAAGGNHTCALGREGGLTCWGSNKYGELGDGTLENRPEPVAVAGLTAGVDSFSVGGFHTCAIAGGATLKCWGWNAYGQLGDSTPTDRATPVDVRWLAGSAAFVSAGYDFTCALMRAGNLRCWGNNEFGQLGDGTAVLRHTPVDVQGFQNRAFLLAAGFYSTCGLTMDGVLKCWGNNLYGQLGNGSTANSNVPVDVLGLS
jgi:alpha-tubulin suppressor-like RCC1 family protein